MENNLVCPRCGNKDPRYFYNGQRGWYCRKCVGYKRILIEDDLEPFTYKTSGEGEFSFDYELTKYQKDASKKCKEYLKDYDVLLHCVCGAGKTEIIVESLAHYLSLGLKVCYAISRKEVVIELSERFKKIFKSNSVVAVYGGHHDVLTADLIVCTTHQLYRYPKTFDLLVLDEVDAFPLKGNDTLMNISLNASKGRVVFSSATVNDFLENYLKERNYKEVNLFIRPSLKPLIIPKVYILPKIMNFILLVRIMLNTTNQCIIFTSTKKECYFLYMIFKRIFDCGYVYSDSKTRQEMIEDFRNKKFQFIFATTVLERGITIKDVDVIIYVTHKDVFDKASIIQMSGRVGRSISKPYGNSYLLINHFSKEVKMALNELKEANKYYEMSIL